jgi:hypothetical protein
MIMEINLLSYSGISEFNLKSIHLNSKISLSNLIIDYQLKKHVPAISV